MNLFNYTKKLSQKIKFYDEITKFPYFGVKNPFAKPLNITVIWVENEK
jgi:hypothetical protein